MSTRFALFYIILASFAASTLTPMAAAQDSEQPDQNRIVTVNSSLNHELLDHNQNLRKIDLLLDARTAGRIDGGRLYVGASVISLIDYQRSNRNSKFAYLMRHPTSGNQIGKQASEVVLHSAQFLIAGSVTDWLTVYGEVLYDPEQSFGAGTITALGRNQLQLRKGYVMFGNLRRFPVYGAVGKMDVNFGEMGSVSPFTNSTMWHAFGALGYGAVAGVRSHGLNVSLTAVQGGAQFRALNAPVDSTSVPSRVNNYTVDANYTATLGGDLSVKVGASHAKGTAYCQGFPVVHFQPCGESNAARSVYGVARLREGLVIKGAYARTLDVWPGSHNPTPPLDVFEASKVSSLSAGVSYRVFRTDAVDYLVSGEFSNFVAGPDGSPWERQNQYVAGFAATIKKSSCLFLELFRTEGYVPLNFISGGNLENIGETHSDAGARSFGVVLGAQVTL